MKWQEIYKTLQNYREETRKGWYSYTWCNYCVTIARKSEPNIHYTFWDKKIEEYSVLKETLCETEEIGKYFWGNSEHVSLADLPEADDYIVASAISHPFIAMIAVKSDVTVNPENYIFKNFRYRTAQEIQENIINQKALNNIKNIIRNVGDIYYNVSHGWVSKEDKEKIPKWIENCGFCGTGENEYTEAEFYLNNQEIFICTPGNLARYNKHRRHFGEPEYLFPWVSNNLEKDEVLYVRTSSLATYKGTALEMEKEKTRKNLDMLLKESGVFDYDLIEIKRTYKYNSK